MVIGKPNGLDSFVERKGWDVTRTFTTNMPADDYEERLRRKELSSAVGGLGGGSRGYQPPPPSSSIAGSAPFQDKIRHESFEDRSVSSTTSAAASSTGGLTFEERLKQKLSSEAIINRDRAKSHILKSSRGGPTNACAAIVHVGKAATPTSAIDQQAYFGVAEVSFDDVFALLRSFQQEGNAIDDGATEEEEDACGLIMPVSHPSFTKLLDTMASGGMEELLKKRWDYQFAGLKAYKREHGDCFIPIDHPTLGLWTRIQRDQYEKQGGGGVAIVEGSVTGLTKKRFTRLKEIGFDDFVRWSLEQDDGGQVTNCSTRSTPTTTSDSSEQLRNTKESLRAELSRKINTYNSSRVRVSSRPFSIPTDEQNTTTANTSTSTNTAQKKLGVVTTMKDKELSKRMGNIDEDYEVKSLSLLDLPPRRATEIGNDDVAAERRRMSWSELDTAVALAITQSIKER